MWLVGDLLEVYRNRLRPFYTAVANPPFGALARSGDAPGYRGSRFEYHAIAVAAHIARHGVFPIPQQSAPFRYSGERHMDHDRADAECRRFQSGTGITLEPSCGIDTAYYREDWHHPPVLTEVVTTDFSDFAIARRRRSRASATHRRML
jgi:hypothetical protein